MLSSPVTCTASHPVCVRARWQVPIRFCGNLLAKATKYYKLFQSWTNERMRGSGTSPSVTRNPFDYRYITSIDEYANGVIPSCCLCFTLSGVILLFWYQSVCEKAWRSCQCVS